MCVKTVMVTGGFDDLRSVGIRFLQEASRLGEVHVALWTDDAIRALEGREPKFPEAERRYLLDAVRYVKRVIPMAGLTGADALPQTEDVRADLWVMSEQDANSAKQEFCLEHGMEYRVIAARELEGFPPLDAHSDRKSVV